MLRRRPRHGHPRAAARLRNERLAGPLPANLALLSYGGLGLLPCDVGLLQVSAPGDDGLVSLGIGMEYVADALRYTPTLIAEVNRQMPRTRGASRLPLSAFAATIETDRPLREAPGALPSAVLGALSGHADLGRVSGAAPG